MMHPFIVIACLALPARAEELPRGAFVGVAANPGPSGNGVLVAKVIAGGSAEQAGIKPNDVLTRIDDHPLTTPEDFVATVKTLHAGQVVTLRFVRDGKDGT